MTINNNNKHSAKPRPIDYGVLHSRLPIGALTSISHRISGVLLVILLPLIFALLERSLASEAEFVNVQSWLQGRTGKIFVVLALWVFAQHFFAGLRHLLQDIDIAIERSSGRRTAFLVWLASVITTLLFAGWIY